MKRKASVNLLTKSVYIFIFLFPFLAVLYSCNSNYVESIDMANNKVEEIRILPDEKLVSVNFTDYFSSWKAISLETNSNSLIGNISRISMFKSNYYILDTQTNSIFIFNSEGKFLNKIHKIGKGEGEYIGLMDFTIDEKKNQIILYSHRPYKLLFYNLKGHFIHEERMEKLYYNISISDGNILFLNSKVQEGFMVYSVNIETQSKKKIMPIIQYSDYFKHFRLNTPSLIRGKSTNLTFPYTDTIYEAENNKISAKYYVDFGSKKIPDGILLDKKLTPTDVYKIAMDNSYGFGISNFKELNDMIYFSYGPNICVFYFKEDKTAITFSFVKNDENYLEFGNIFAHDGDDNDLISIYPATKFKSRMANLSQSKRYNSLPASIKRIDSEISEISNPLLLVYTLKKKPKK